jgi:hypothetical protein
LKLSDAPTEYQQLLDAIFASGSIEDSVAKLPEGL